MVLVGLEGLVEQVLVELALVLEDLEVELVQV